MQVSVFRQECGQHDAIVVIVFHPVRGQFLETSEQPRLSLGQGQEENPELGHAQDFLSQLLQRLQRFARVVAQLAQVDLAGVRQTKGDYILPVEQHLELFLPLLRVVVLQPLERQRTFVVLDLASFGVFFKYQLKLLKQARAGELRCLEAQVFLGHGQRLRSAAPAHGGGFFGWLGLFDLGLLSPESHQDLLRAERGDFAIHQTAVLQGVSHWGRCPLDGRGRQLVASWGLFGRLPGTGLAPLF